MNNSNIYVTKTSMPPYEEYIEAIKPLWESHWITNMGEYHQQLEKQLAKYLEVPEISLTVNGHMALELAIQSFDFPEGSEIITTPFTFISTTHAIVRNRLKPIFCDIKEDGTINENRIEDLITEKTVAILPVHVYGNICNVDKIEQIANDYNLKVIYDAAHAFGEKYHDQCIGNFGDISTFSFHATKVFNTIEGGAIVCKSHDTWEKIRDLKNFGIRGEELVAAVGANAKMNEFSAIMGLCNLKRIDEVKAIRKSIYDYYEKKLKNIKGIGRYTQREGAISNYGYFPIKILEDYPLNRDELYMKLKDNGIYARKYFYPITADQVCFKNKYRNTQLENARKLSKSTLVIPLYEGLDIDNQIRIMDIICNK